MRIAELFFFMDMGGVERCIANLANALPADVFDVSVIVSHHGGLMEKQLSPRVPFVRLGEGARLAQLVELLRGFDAAHTNTTNLNPFFTWAAALANVPILVDTIHAPIEGNPYASYTDRTICVSKFGASTQPRPRRTQVVYNSVRAPLSISPRTPDPGRPIVLLEMRRADKEMRFSLAQLAPLFATRPALAQVQCWILGMEGPSTDNLRFLGRVAEPWSILSQADFLVHFPAFEALPNGVLESMGHGAIPLTAPVGGLPEVVCDGLNGILRDLPSTEALLTLLAETCTAYRDDRPRFERMRAAGSESVRTRFSEERMRDGYAGIFQTLAAEGQPRPPRVLSCLLGGGRVDEIERELLSVLESYCFERPRALRALGELDLLRFSPPQRAFLSGLRAADLLEAGQAEAAHALLAPTIAHLDGDPTLHALFAQAAMGCGAHETGRVHFERAFALDPDNVYFGLETLQGFLELGKVPEARARISAMLDGVSEDHQAFGILTGLGSKLGALSAG